MNSQLTFSQCNIDQRYFATQVAKGNVSPLYPLALTALKNQLIAHNLFEELISMATLHTSVLAFLFEKAILQLIPDKATNTKYNMIALQFGRQSQKLSLNYVKKYLISPYLDDLKLHQL